MRYIRIESSAFDPTGLFNVWYDGENVIETSNKVEQLTDQSTSGNNATQATVVDKPGYTAVNASFNGLPTINPSNSKMSIGTAFNLNLNSTFTAFFVGVQTGTYWSMWESSATSGSYMWEQLTATGSYFRDGTNLAIANSGDMTVAGIWMFYNTGTQIFAYNARTGITNSVSSTALGTISIDRLFERSTGSVNGTGQMAQCSINPTTNLDTASKNSVGQFLSAKYALTWTDI